MHKFILLLAGVFLMSATPAFAQDEAATNKKESDVQVEEKQEAATPAEKLAEYQEELKKLGQELQAKFAKAQKELVDEGRDAIMDAMVKLQKEMQADTNAINKRILEVAEMFDEDPETSFEAIKLLLINPDDPEVIERAGKILADHHLDNEEVPDVLETINMPTQAAQNVFELVIEKSGEREFQAQISLALLNFIERATQMAPLLEENEQVADMFPHVASYLESMSAMDEESLIERMNELKTEYGDVEIGDTTIAEMIAKKIKVFEIRSQVKIGKVAPEIEGPDIDGENFKLSDYRGKVVMLDFWGDW